MSKHDTALSGEDRLIARYFKPLATDPGAFGLDDDAAAIKPPAGCDLVLKTDGIVAGVHFFPDDPPDTVARKALRVNLSDLAAKGARPVGFLLTLALPKDTGDAWLAPFARALGEDASAYGCPLFGGDTDSTPGPITISIAVIGAVPRGRMLRRAGGRPGDAVVVTGTIGDAALGLLLKRDPAAGERWRLSRSQQDHLTQRYLVPQPRLAIAELIADYATAAMDVSDGLAGDLAKLCRASRAGARIEVKRVPLSGPARAVLEREPAQIDTVLTGGDDYEVLACVPVHKVAVLRRQASAAGVEVTDIGSLTRGEANAQFVDVEGKQLAFAHPSYAHF
jgi:thiamine-monophosphate kinase